MFGQFEHPVNVIGSRRLNELQRYQELRAKTLRDRPTVTEMCRVTPTQRIAHLELNKLGQVVTQPVFCDEVEQGITIVSRPYSGKSILATVIAGTFQLRAPEPLWSGFSDYINSTTGYRRDFNRYIYRQHRSTKSNFVNQLLGRTLGKSETVSPSPFEQHILNSISGK